MVNRYTRPELGHIWSEDNKYDIWLKIEIYAVEAREKAGLVPKGVSERLWKNAKVNARRIEEIEETTKHDVIAFLTNVEETAGEDSRFVHIGMTSSDVLDTCLAVQMKQAGEHILSGLNKLSEICAKRAVEFKHTPCVGRSHGIHAETMTFGMKFALWYDECQRNIQRFERALETAATGMISGAVGTYEHLSPEVEKHVCESLGLKPVNISTQVISRDIHAEYLNAIAMIGGMIEKIGIEIRHLQRTEVREAEEFFSPGQKGSSAMPHKRNPIASENICGQARFLRTNALAGIENIALWHERDISHSSVERVIMPDSTISCDYILNRTIKLLDKLVVYPDRMLEVLNMTFGLTHSQKVLLALVENGIQRQTAYVMVQRNAMKAWDNKEQFLSVLKTDDEVMDNFSEEELEGLFSYRKVYESVDFMFERLGLS
jgi:adenylosuccinate lyase